MTAVYSVPNQAWIVLFGDTVQSINFRRFWPKKSDLADDLRMCGLKLGKGNKIVPIGEICSNCGAALSSDGGCKTCTICGTSTGCI